MLKIIEERHPVTETYYSREFQRVGDYKGSGYSFDCGKDGNVIFNSECSKKSYEYCINNPEYEDRGVVTEHRRYIEPTIAKCDCGCIIHLTGDIECDCGQWYNIFGQELLPPEYWHDDEYDY